MNKIIWGISALNHDASISVVKGDEILFCAHAERYSRIKNDPDLNYQMVNEALSFGCPSKIIWFERPYVKKLRQAYARQWDEVFSTMPAEYLSLFGLSAIPVEYVPHHESHAAAGFYTSPFEDAAIVVVDAIGEWDTISVWHGKDGEMRKIFSSSYPNSLGLLYSAVTQRVGLKPNEEEYILMGMAAYGAPIYYDAIKRDFIKEFDAPHFTLKENVHRGIRWWRDDINSEQEQMDLAASIQLITEEFMCGITAWAQEMTRSKNLVLMGGCALNCVANEKIARQKIFDDIWIMPNPGDAGSSLGAILAYTQEKVNWKTPYLGTDIVKPFDIQAAVYSIKYDGIIGIAHGRAEFGPRALGNRSLIADPRGLDIKARVNDIKRRQRFRPFAPMILEEVAHQFFDMPVKTSPYMQYTAQCLYPKLYPAICHIDGSSRVQTINKKQNPLMHEVLDRFYELTGCPMLLNTSLNIRGDPLVNTWDDALEFQKKYNVPIY